jgi:hypothetical protein
MVEDQNVGGSRQGSTLLRNLTRGDQVFCCQSCREGTKELGTLDAVGLH